MQELRRYLARVQPGEIGPGDRPVVERLLAESWNEFQQITENAHMEPNKLLDRTEHLTWKPPLLTFDIERHGGTVLGSVYAEVYSWTLDLASGTAAMGYSKRRVVRKIDRPFKVKPLAEEIAKAILEHKTHPAFEWKGDYKVRVRVDKIIPTTCLQTTADRRRKFWQALCSAVSPYGWGRTSKQSPFLVKGEANAKTIF